MNRVRMLLGLLALFLFPQILFAAAYDTTVGQYTVHSDSDTWLGVGWMTSDNFYNYYGHSTVTTNGEWVYLSKGLYSITKLSTPVNGYTHQAYLIQFGSLNSSSTARWIDRMQVYLLLNSVCDISDDDSDGVCNSCDSKPGESDPKHCIWTQSVTSTGQVVTMVIDQSGKCDGSQTVTYTNSELSSEKTYWDLGTSSQEMTAPTCQGDDGTGNCGCGYPKSGTIFSNFEQDPNTNLSQGLKDQIQEQKENKDDPNYDNCSNIKARCEAACLSRGGVVTNTCTVSGDTTYANCKCQNEYAFDIATPTETSTDTSTNGNVAETGGTDTNADGKADVYAAVKDAIHDSGVTSKLDSANTQLNNIGNKIDTVGSAINGLGSAVNGVGQGVNGLGTKLDTIAGKLDNLNNNANQDYTITGSADIPGNNNYNSEVQGVVESSLTDAIADFISSGLPIVDYFRGTFIDIGSSNPTMSANIFGSTITIDFSGSENILHNIGLVLIMISTVIAFMIIIRKG